MTCQIDSAVDTLTSTATVQGKVTVWCKAELPATNHQNLWFERSPSGEPEINHPVPPPWIYKVQSVVSSSNTKATQSRHVWTRSSAAKKHWDHRWCPHSWCNWDWTWHQHDRAHGTCKDEQHQIQQEEGYLQNHSLSIFGRAHKQEICPCSGEGVSDSWNEAMM